MKLVRYNDPLRTPLRAFDNWYAPALARTFGSFDRLFDLAGKGLPGSGTLQGSAFCADLYEDAENYYARVEMPGVKKTEVQVSLDEQQLSIGFERKSEEGTEPSTTGHRSLTVPDGVDSDKVSAQLEDGVLTVTLPKAEKLKPRTIEVN